MGGTAQAKVSAMLSGKGADNLPDKQNIWEQVRCGGGSMSG
jgi:hypothetical protein